jgi:murein DD-endopeptidase MepM/ murein hydrolase activator NlpD
MRPYLRFLAISFMGLLVGAAAPSDETAPDHFQQGQLAALETEPGAQVLLDGEPVTVFPGGRYYLGFGRDAAQKALLQIRHPDGTVEKKELIIEKRDYPVQKLSLPEKMVTPPKKVLERIEADTQAIREKRGVISEPCHFTGTFLKPANGPVSGVFGSQRILNGKPKDPHMGMDIAAGKGAPIMAPEDGTVRLLRDMYYTGNTLLLDHGCGVSTVYAHMEKVFVKEGDAIKRGQKIGLVGATGRATGPHLHWGLNLMNLRLDPELELLK